MAKSREKEEKSWRWFDIRHSSWVWLKSRKKDFYVLFTNGYRTPGNERWELESRLAKETFFRARFEAKQKPISRPCPSLACLLSSSLFSYGGGALRCTAAVTSRQFSSKKSSLSIYFIDNISIRQAVGTEGVQVGHPKPSPRFWQLYNSSPSKDIVYYFPFRFLVLPKAPPCYWWQGVK